MEYMKKFLAILIFSVMLSDQISGRVLAVDGESDGHKAESCYDLNGSVPMVGDIPDSLDCHRFYTCVHSASGGVEPISRICPIGHDGLPLIYDFRACECSESRAKCYNYADWEHNMDRFKCACHKDDLECQIENELHQ